MSIKNQSIVGLFILLVIILAVNPKIVNNIYGTVLGRVFLIGITIFFAMYNTTLGLLVALTIIAASNQFGSFTEGMDNATPTTIGDDNVSTTPDAGKIAVLTQGAVADAVQKKKSELTDVNKSEGSEGIDKETIKTAIMSKNSNTIAADKSSSDEVEPSVEGMLNRIKNNSYDPFATAASVNRR
jgi:hypothetical protein